MNVSVSLHVQDWQALLNLLGNQPIATGLHPLAMAVKDQVESGSKAQQPEAPVEVRAETPAD